MGFFLLYFNKLENTVFSVVGFLTAEILSAKRIYNENAYTH